MTPDLKPVKGMVVLKFLDDEEDSASDANASYGTPQTADRERTCIAQVVAAGAETNVKRGQVVIVRSYARSAPEIEPGAVIADAYTILAVIATA
jgi:hypothetical protein